MLRRSLTILLGVMFVFVLAGPVAAQNESPTDALRDLAHMAEESEGQAVSATPDQLRAAYEALHEDWESFEDAVRTGDPAGYVALEGKLDALKEAVSAPQPDTATTQAAFAALEHEAIEVAERMEGASPGGAAAEPATMAGFAADLDAAANALQAGNAAEAAERLQAATRAWPSVEGEVATKSPDAYTAIEVDLGKANAALEATPADLAAAAAAVADLRATVAPFVQSTTTYGIFDAAAILLREGLEALLVIAALLTFLRRSGNSDKRGWIWMGGLAGILASVLAGFALQSIFSAASAGQNRELVEGITGLVAAAMLFYVAYWLHSKTSMSAWKRYIDVQTSKALASGSLFGLALLAFLAVFREGAETVVFYLGIAPSIPLRDLLLGFAIGAGALALIAVLMLIFSVRLPLRLFFRIAGLLVAYLGFKFVGTGIHALQVAGVITSNPVPVPSIPFFGIYPTWETLLPQIILLTIGAGALIYMSIRDRRALASTQLA